METPIVVQESAVPEESLDRHVRPDVVLYPLQAPLFPVHQYQNLDYLQALISALLQSVDH